jgi:hypothetical protein
MKNLLKTAAVVCMMGAGAAHAAPIKIDYQADGLFGAGNLRQTVTISTPGAGYDGSVRAGMFHLTGDSGLGDFLELCPKVGDGHH